MSKMIVSPTLMVMVAGVKPFPSMRIWYVAPLGAPVDEGGGDVLVDGTAVGASGGVAVGRRKGLSRGRSGWLKRYASAKSARRTTAAMRRVFLLMTKK